VQTREHLFKNCPRWKPQQRTLWAEVRRETGREKNRFKIRDLFADERCSRPILDFLGTTEVGRRTGPDNTGETVEPDGVGEETHSGDSEEDEGQE
jgi:hypothetical protein